MLTVDRLRIRAPLERVLDAAVDVEQWPAFLSHYRWVRMLQRNGEGGLVEMAAWRPFGKVRYPTWWVSEMQVDRQAPVVRYRHVRGITRGMDVEWRLQRSGRETEVEIVHEWTGPPWPGIGPAAATLVIGPVFIHGIASRTLAGLARHVEAAGPQGSGAASTSSS
jgi:ribosome-associated toxin RatA of RatAB toxin-antitoxin module